MRQNCIRLLGCIAWLTLFQSCFGQNWPQNCPYPPDFPAWPNQNVFVAGNGTEAVPFEMTYFGPNGTYIRYVWADQYTQDWDTADGYDIALWRNYTYHEREQRIYSAIDNAYHAKKFEGLSAYENGSESTNSYSLDMNRTTIEYKLSQNNQIGALEAARIEQVASGSAHWDFTGSGNDSDGFTLRSGVHLRPSERIPSDVNESIDFSFATSDADWTVKRRVQIDTYSYAAAYEEITNSWPNSGNPQGSTTIPATNYNVQGLSPSHVIETWMFLEDNASDLLPYVNCAPTLLIWSISPWEPEGGMLPPPPPGGGGVA